MISDMSEKEKLKIFQQHKDAMKKHQDKVNENKKGLQKPKKAV
jgi:hypothetical protein